VVEEHLGLHVESPGSAGWSDILRQRIGETNSPSFDAYRQRFASALTRREEVAQLARVMTVGETYFFRDSRQFEALSTVILPELLHRRSPTDRVAVLSVACSTGEEPYSVAIAARELLGARADRIQIYAFDINPAAIANAERATYSEWSLRATPSALKNRYFTRKGSVYSLPPEVKAAVTFEVRNLFEDDPEFFLRGRFDVILFRNALIYFSRPKIAIALRRLTDLLAEDGALFLGNAETPRGIEDRLVPEEVCGSFCYRLGTGESSKLPPISVEVTDSSLGSITRPLETAQSGRAVSVVASTDGAWVAAIDAATRRLADLVPSRPPGEPSTQRADKGLERERLLEEVRALVAREQFRDALARLDELVSANERDGQVHLLRASILTNQGRFVEASDVCRRLLADEPHSAGAYHLLGVSSEQLGRLSEARSYHETAITLDRDFAMSYWLLGRLCLRLGQREEARRHLTRALELFRLEAEPSKASSHLYTGGFGRDTFAGLCRSDLARCEVRR
jgi:chemotaxis protein methyltransferase CheR